MNSFRRSAGFVASALACLFIGAGISTAFSGGRDVPTASKSEPRTTFVTRQAERAGVMTYSIVIQGTTTSSNLFVIPAGVEIDVETVTLQNGDYSGSGGFDKLGLTLERASAAGTDYQFFVSNAFETRVFSYSPPLRIRSGDTLNVHDSANGQINGYVQVSFHGRVVPQATGFQAR